MYPRSTVRLFTAPLFGALLILAATLAPAAEVAPAPAAPAKAIRIKAGVTEPLKDETGVVWEAERGFADGDSTERGDIAIANTKTPSLYRTEHYSMSKFSVEVPNGKYTVKLHFAETFEDITDKGQRVFSFTVGGKEFKDFDIFAKAGGSNRAYVETVPVVVKDGKIEVTFSAITENPEINAIEIIPEA